MMSSVRVLCAAALALLGGDLLRAQPPSPSARQSPAPSAPAAQTLSPIRPIRPPYASKGAIEVLPVQGSVYMLAGAGSNITVQVGDDAVFVVDTNEGAMSEKVLAAVRSITNLPIRYIVNTSADADHVGGNEALAKAGGGNVNQFLAQAARVYASENAYSRLSNPKDGSAPVPVSLWPTDSFAAPKKTLFVTGEPIEILHQPAAHTDGDLMVFFRKSDVLSTGDVFVTSSYPVIDVKRGGTLQGVIDSMNRIIDITVPEFNAMGGTRIIPGHGRICNEIDAVEYRDMLTIIRDRVALMISEGKTLEQVKAARVSLDYDGVYGLASGPWTTEMFLETAYKELSAAGSKSSRLTPVQKPQTTSAQRPQPPSAARTAGSARRASDPFDGRWALNTAKSQYVPANTMPYRREMTITINGDELTQATSTWRRTASNDSPLSRVTYTAKFDGKEYPVEASSARVSLKRVDASAVERTATGDRGAKETARWMLSTDRKSLTIVTTGVDAAGNQYSSTQVYDRQ